jgi:hypothetical protein
MTLIPGKQTTGVLRPDVAVPWTVAQDAGSQRLTNLGAPTLATDAARLQDVYNLPEKQICRLSSTVNLSLTGAATCDGSAVVTGNRILVQFQTAPAENGIYDANTAGAWTRSADANTAALLQGATVSVSEGATLANRTYYQTADNIVLGTTAIVWIQIGGPGVSAAPSTSNKNMVASVTAVDGALACATALVSTPTGGSYVEVQVNGATQSLGNGVKTDSCYFSADGGTTARAYSAIQAADLLYWVGTVAGFQLAATDRINFLYNA